MIEFVEYRDDKIRVKLPKQLRQQSSQRLFRGNLVHAKPESNLMVAISIDLDEQSVQAIKEEFNRTKIKNRPPRDKVERLGPSKFGKDGLELLTSFVQPNTGHTFYRWDIFYRLQRRYVMFGIMGGGNREDFENMAKEIVMSLEFL